ncbi:hypothetical protein GW17_00020139, partial [Ensete ventricosum]
VYHINPNALDMTIQDYLVQHLRDSWQRPFHPLEKSRKVKYIKYWLSLCHSAVKIITSKSSKQSLGLAYIWFAHEQDALMAVKEMNGK